MSIFKNKICLYVIGLFVFTLLFSLLIPMGGDDWGNYLRKGASFAEILSAAKSFYMTFEGRFFSRIFDFLLVPNGLLFAIIKSILFSLLFYLIYKIVNVNEKYLPFILMGILFVDFETFAQVYVWRTGCVTYLFPMVYAFILIFIRRKNIFEDDCETKWWSYLFIPLTFVFSMFTENTAIAIIFVCLLNVIYYFVKYKKIDISMVLCLISAIAGFCLMYFSPGTQNRASGSDAFMSLSFIGKILYNIPNLVNYTFIKNIFITILLVILMSIIVWKNFNNRVLKYLTLCFIAIPACLTCIIYLLSAFIVLPNVVLKVINSQNIFIDIYWVLFAILFIILIFRYLKVDKQILYFLILALITGGAMMMSPIWGGRTACITTFMLFMVIVLCFKKLNLSILNTKWLFVFANVLCFTFMCLFTLYSIYIYDLNCDRTKYINYQRKNGAEKYEILILPRYYTWNLNTWGSDGDFAYSFKKAYGIKKDAELIYVNKETASVDVNKIKASSKMKG